MNDYLEKIKKNIQVQVRELFVLKIINNAQLFGAIGEYYKEPDQNSEAKFEKTRQYAAYFKHQNKFAHYYPLFKSHKLPFKTYPGHETLPPNKIPVRMVTSCTQAMTTRATALLQLIYGDLVSEKCGSEFCLDTPDYLRAIKTSKYQESLSNFINENNAETQLFIVAIDVVGLYPNSPREFVLNGLKKILQSKYDEAQVDSIIALTEYCLENTIIAMDNEPFSVMKGILTGASNSTSLANAFLTQITQPVRSASDILLFKRFIDDVICHMFCTRARLNNFIDNCHEEFGKFSMKIEARIAAGEGEDAKEAEFLDVNHVFKGKNQYETFNFVKPTAKGRRFLSGESFHPSHVFKGIIGGESKRLRRLNSTDDGWLTSMKDLKEKCKRSQFNGPIIDEMIDKITAADMGQEQALEPAQKKEAGKNIPWPTSIPVKYLAVTEKQHKLLAKDAKLQPIYRKPPSLHSQIPACHHRRILNPPKSTPSNNNLDANGTQPCGNCKLCGKRGATRSMIKTENTNKVYSSSGREFTLKSTLNCKNFGIYQLRCRTCLRENRRKIGVYVGMTADCFHKRFGGHRSNFKLNISNLNSDRYALAKHYKEVHGEEGLPTLEEAYELNFLEEPVVERVRQAEDKWSRILEANINVQEMTTNKIR